MLDRSENKMTACEFAVICIGEIAKLLGKYSLFDEFPLSKADAKKLFAWSGIDMGILIADTKDRGSMEILEREMKSAREAGVVALPIVIAEGDAAPDSPCLLVNPYDFKTEEQLCEFIYLAISSVREIVDQTGLVDLDISDFQKFVEGKGRLIFAYGESEQGRQDAVKQAIEKASAKTSSSEPCELLMINVTGSEENMSMSEIVKTTEEIQAALAGDQCSIIWGANVDDNLGHAVRVSIWIRR